MDNPAYSERESELGKQVGMLRAENDVLKLKLSAAHVKNEALEHALSVGSQRLDGKRRDVLRTPLLNHHRARLEDW